MTANAAIEPSTSAIAVASERRLAATATSASRISSLCQATRNHFVEKPAIGQLWMFDGLNA